MFTCSSSIHTLTIADLSEGCKQSVMQCFPKDKSVAAIFDHQPAIYITKPAIRSQRSLSAALATHVEVFQYDMRLRVPRPKKAVNMHDDFPKHIKVKRNMPVSCTD